MRIFAEGDLSQHLSSLNAQVDRDIKSEDKHKLLNVNEIEYIDYLLKTYRLEPLNFEWDKISVGNREEYIAAERFPSDFFVRAGESYPKQIITYHIPMQGSKQLLHMQPSHRIMWSTNVEILSNSVCFNIVNWRDDPEAIKSEADHIINNIRQQSEYVNQEVNAFNNGLENHIKTSVASRKSEFLKQDNLLSRLGVPVKPAANVPNTFSVPIRKNEPIIKKPQASAEPFKPEPALDESTFKSILKICHDTGIEIERHPGIYQGKDEETLRDHFLMVLSPHFQSASGETFNKSGKTDILIRHEGKNVFIAECKYWRGQKIHIQTLDQILSYLTWRDSKAAILYFVKNKELGPVLQQIESETPNHSCYVKYCGKVAEGAFQFNFHLKDDSTRGIELAILCFHFPE